MHNKHKNIFTPFNIIFSILVVGAVAYGANKYFNHHGMKVTKDANSNLLVMPELSLEETKGQEIFTENCSTCHGVNGIGSENGPPLIHIIYEPSHHGDASFYNAAARGVQSHHWRFGNMPAIETVNRRDVSYIISFIRRVQRANNID
ncbi:MAG: c-type cytochrome [Alphaproteobacteria bacterium]